MFGCSLQEKAELLFSGGRAAVEHLKCLRDPIIDGDYQAYELGLGIPRAVVEQLRGFSGDGEAGDGARAGEPLTTALGQGVVVEQHPQEPSHHVHGGLVRLNVLAAFLKGCLRENKCS